MLNRFVQIAPVALAAMVWFSPEQAEALPSYQVTKPDGYADYTVTVNGPESNLTGTFRAGPFQLTNTADSTDAFIAWCFDLVGTVTFGNSYPYQASTFLSVDQLTRVQKLFDATYSIVGTDPIGTLNGQGFQLALWDTIYDTDFNINAGGFKATASNPAGIIGQAQTFLTAAKDYDEGQKWLITQLDGGSGVQKLGTATAIPLPAAAWLLLGVSGALVAAKRRRGASKA